MYVRMRACVRARVGARVRACMCACACVRVHARVCVLDAYRAPNFHRLIYNLTVFCLQNTRYFENLYAKSNN